MQTILLFSSEQSASVVTMKSWSCLPTTIAAVGCSVRVLKPYKAAKTNKSKKIANKAFIIANYCQFSFYCFLPTKYGGKVRETVGFLYDRLCIEKHHKE